MATRVGYFEMISTYFVKIYYNYLYDEAVKKAKSSQNINTTLADEYRAALRAFKEALTKSQRYYYDTVKDIWQTFQLISPITLPDFIDTVVKLFIPDSYHSELINENLRDKYMAKLVLNMVGDFSTKINNMYVNKIVDEKQRNKALINILQDDFNAILENIRSNMHQTLTEKSVSSNAKIPVDAFNKMKDLLILSKEKIDKLESENRELYNKIDNNIDYKRRIVSLEAEIEQLKEELAKTKKKYDNEEKELRRKNEENLEIERRRNDAEEKRKRESENEKKKSEVPLTKINLEIINNSDSDSETPTAEQIIAKRKSKK